MKKVIYSIVAVTALFLASCGDAKTTEKSHEGHDHSEMSNGQHEGHDHSEISSEKYACPMKCEEEKTYDEKGDCPKCHMGLVEID